MANAFTVYFDGSCPVCRKEIAIYRRMNGADRIDWVDLSQIPDNIVSPDLDKESALRRFHVRTKGGTLLSGAKAFVSLWRQYRSLRWQGRVFALPILVQGLELGYRGFLLIRPLWHPERCSDQLCSK